MSSSKHIKTMGRVGVYVDCSSLWHGSYGFAQSLGLDQPRVDYRKLLDLMSGGNQTAVIKAFITARPYVDVGGFANALRGMRYDVELSDPSSKTSWATMNTALVKDAENLDTVAIATQDVSHASTITRLLDMGKQVILFAFPPHGFTANLSPAVIVNSLGRDVLLTRRARAAQS